jgi:hypothetical protein
MTTAATPVHESGPLQFGDQISDFRRHDVLSQHGVLPSWCGSRQTTSRVSARNREFRLACTAVAGLLARLAVARISAYWCSLR